MGVAAETVVRRGVDAGEAGGVTPRFLLAWFRALGDEIEPTAAFNAGYGILRVA